MKQVSTAKKRQPIIHGLYARDVLQPWDDPDEFIALHESLRQEFFPNGPSEEQFVFDLAQLYWTKGRLYRRRTAKIASDPFSQEIAATKRHSWAGIRNALRKKARKEHTIRGKMEATVAEGFAELVKGATKAMAESDPAEATKVATKFDALAEIFKQTFLPWLEQVKLLPDAEGAFEKNYSTDALEQIIRLEAQLDARVSKVLATLVSLKEYKRTPAGKPLAQLSPPAPFQVAKQQQPAQH